MGIPLALQVFNQKSKFLVVVFPPDDCNAKGLAKLLQIHPEGHAYLYIKLQHNIKIVVETFPSKPWRYMKSQDITRQSHLPTLHRVYQGQ